jgi:hypothetical protein
MPATARKLRLAIAVSAAGADSDASSMSAAIWHTFPTPTAGTTKLIARFEGFIVRRLFPADHMTARNWTGVAVLRNTGMLLRSYRRAAMWRFMWRRRLGGLSAETTCRSMRG